ASGRRDREEADARERVRADEPGLAAGDREEPVGPGDVAEIGFEQAAWRVVVVRRPGEGPVAVDQGELLARGVEGQPAGPSGEPSAKLPVHGVEQRDGFGGRDGEAVRVPGERADL